MIVVPGKLVIATPPRTASRALHQALLKHGAVQVSGPSVTDDNPVVAHDTRVVPEEYRDLPLYVSVRHPADRLVSLWRLVQEWPTELPAQKLEWHEFVRKVAARDDSFYRPWWHTLSDFCRGLVLTGTIRFESLEEDLSRVVGHWIDVPAVGVSRRDRDWRTYYDTELAAIARQWAADDLVAFGYDWD